MTAPAVRIHHPTSRPYRFLGRSAELALLDQAIRDEQLSVVALVGPGGQGKTAVVQHWLGRLLAGGGPPVRGVFLWSFYHGKDADLCLRELYAFVAGLDGPPDVSAAYCVDHLLPLLQSQPWVLVLDGTEVVQYETGPWFGRFIHPELGRLVEELASAPSPGVLLLTSRFPVAELEHRTHVRRLRLGTLDPASAQALLRLLGVRGDDPDLDEAADSCGRHAKAVELLGTYLARFHQGRAGAHRDLPHPPPLPGGSDEEQKVHRVVHAFQTALPTELQDVLALATAFREPPTLSRLLAYLASEPVHRLLHDTWQRPYVPFRERGPRWLEKAVRELVDLRLLEHVALAPGDATATDGVIDAHPLVRRTFEHVLGSGGRREHARARAGFLSGRPGRRRPASLEEAREEVELFHAYCDAGLWDEAERALIDLDRPRYRFLAPAWERDLLLRFFPGGDWRRPPLWPRFRHHRALAVCLEMLGCWEDALAAYREEDAPLRGDALIALGRLRPLLEDRRPPHPWQTLWQCYQAHALCLAGRTADAVTLARSLVPVDVYEWAHVFECLLRAGQLGAIHLHSFLYRPASSTEHRWNELARRRMRADYLRQNPTPGDDLGREHEALLDEYDRAGLPYERTLTRLSHARWLLANSSPEEAGRIAAQALDLARRHGMRILEADAWELEADLARRAGDGRRAERAASEAARIGDEVGYHGPARP